MHKNSAMITEMKISNIVQLISRPIMQPQKIRAAHEIKTIGRVFLINSLLSESRNVSIIFGRNFLSLLIIVHPLLLSIEADRDLLPYFLTKLF